MNKEITLSNLQNEFILSQQRVIHEFHLQVKMYEQELSAIKSDLNNQKLRNKMLHEQNQSLKNEIQKIKEHQTILQQTIDQANLKQNDFRIKYNRQYQSLMQKLKQTQSQFNKLKGIKSIEQQQVFKKQHQLSSENRILKQINEKLQQQLQRLQNQLSNFKVQYFHIQENLSYQRAQQNLYSQKYTNLKLKFKEVKHKLKIYEQRLYVAKNENENLENQSQKKHEVFEKNLQKIHIKVNTLQEQNDSYTKLIHELQIQNEALKQSLAQSQMQVIKESKLRAQLESEIGYISKQVGSIVSGKKRLYHTIHDYSIRDEI